MRQLLGTQTTPIPQRPYWQHVPCYNNHRMMHAAVLGGSGSGKSTSLIHWAAEDILNDQGVIFIDPHGSSINELLLHIPPHRRPDTILFDAADTDYPLGFNPLYKSTNAAKTTKTIIEIFEKRWERSWGPYPENYFNACIPTLLAQPRATLLDMLRLLDDEDYLNSCLERVTDQRVHRLWKRLRTMSKRDQQERPMSTINKLFPLLLDDAIANILDQHTSSFDLKEVVQNRKILLLSFEQGALGEKGSAILTDLFLAYLYAVVMEIRNTTPCYLYLDEFHHVSPFFSEMISGIRKFNVGMTMATQFLDQIEDPKLHQAVLSSVGTLMAFRTGPQDAETLSSILGGDSSSLMPFQALVRTPEAQYAVSTELDERERAYRGRFEASPTKIQTIARTFYAKERRY